MIPAEIGELVGRTYCFGIAVDESNIAYGVDFYKAMKVWYLHDIINTESTVESVNLSDKETPMLCCSDVRSYLFIYYRQTIFHNIILT